MSRIKIGVYRIRCLPEKRSYVGSSINIPTRWRSHRHHLRKGIHHSPDLQLHWDMYEEGDFLFEVLRPVDSPSDLPRWESYYIEKERNPYNTSDRTDNPMRDPEVVAKNIAARGDKQKGYRAPAAKFTKEQYLEMVDDLLGDEPDSLVAKRWAVSPKTITNIATGVSHQWLARVHPQFQEMLEHRKAIRKMGRLYSPEWPILVREADTSGKSGKTGKSGESNVPHSRYAPAIHIVSKRKTTPYTKNVESVIVTLYTLRKGEQYLSLEKHHWIKEHGMKLEHFNQLVNGKLLSLKGWFFMGVEQVDVPVDYKE